MDWSDQCRLFSLPCQVAPRHDPLTEQLLTWSFFFRLLHISVTNSPRGYLSLPFFSFLLIGWFLLGSFLKGPLFSSIGPLSSRSFLYLGPWSPLGTNLFLCSSWPPLEFQISTVRGECHSFTVFFFFGERRGFRPRF